MSDEEVMIYLRGDGMLNKVRAAFSSECGRMEQDEQQRTKPTPVERRRMEFEAARHIAEVLGVTL
jgi:hypothetical protein